MSLFSSSRRAGATSTQVPEAPRLMLISVGIYAVAAVILFAVGLVLEGVAFGVMAIATTIGAAYLRALHQRSGG